jgi:predicted NAD/FAD-dependent oxidoreductase
MRTFSFEREKFRELILYIAERTAEAPGFGDVHLNKTLYWADVEAYSSLGRPMTGARYFKLPLGPAAKPLLPVRDELAEEGFVEISEPPPGSYQARKTNAHRPADTTLFADEELQLVDALIERLEGLTTKQVTDLSHEEPGWNLVEMYDDIPYQTALISREPLPEKTLARARERAASVAW